MKTKILLLCMISFMLLSCENKKKQKVAELKYDVSRFQLVKEGEDGVLDTISKTKKIQKTNAIFNAKREYIYSAKFIKDKNILSESIITMQPTNTRWNDSELQETVFYHYEYNEKDSIEFVPYLDSLNLDKHHWAKTYKTGIIENKEKIWMHPFRSNQFVSTEVSPFPMVQLPLSIGKTWNRTLNLSYGWGKWSHKSISNFYEVTNKKSIPVDFTGKKLLNCWVINSSAKMDLGTSYLKSYFHPSYGFVKLEYSDYLGHSMIFKLIDIKRN